LANALGRDIKPGSVVRVAQKHFTKPKSEEERLFVAKDGCGMDRSTMGHAIIGHWQSDGMKDRIEGFMLDKFISEPE